MTDPIGSIGAPRPSRGVVRRSEDAEDETGPDADAAPPAIAAQAPPPQPAPRPRRLGFVAFAAQILGGGQKRGLRAGQETLERARTAYLETEWSGPSDRRLRAGRITKTEV